MFSIDASTIGLGITVLGIIIGAVWWMAALFHRVDAISKQIARFQSHMTSEFGGLNEDGKMTTGNQNRLRKELQGELETQIAELDERLKALEYAS